MTQRSPQQRKSIELYCKLLADALNDGGFDMKAVLEVKTVDVPWSQDMVKEVLWRGIQIPMLDKASTTELETDEVDRVYKVLDRHIAQNFGVHVEFPDRFSEADDAMGLHKEK